MGRRTLKIGLPRKTAPGTATSYLSQGSGQPDDDVRFQVTNAVLDVLA